MQKSSLICLFFTIFVCLTSCGPHKPSVAELRAEKRLQDSLDCVAQQRSVAYTDSLLQILLPRVDTLLSEFRFEKNEAYQDHGVYIYRTLRTEQNDRRNFLRAQLSDHYELSVLSFYYGQGAANASQLILASEENELHIVGSLHRFEAEGVHELLTFSGEDAVRLLRFVDAYQSSRVRVQLIKDSGIPAATYYLNDADKHALVETYRFAVLMQDVNMLEKQQRQASLQVEKYQKRLQK